MCAKAYSAAHHAANRERVLALQADRRAANGARSDADVAADRALAHPAGSKRCRGCRLVLPLEEFRANRTRKDGLRQECRSCEDSRPLRYALPLWEERGLYTCVYCDAPFEHVDHVWPKALGGTDDPWNLVPACAACNTSKSATPVLDWLDRNRPGLLDRVFRAAARYLEEAAA